PEMLSSLASAFSFASSSPPPNVLVEASSQRLVCVSTEVSGVPELMKNGENGLVVPPEDPALLARALEAAIPDPALYL
ncbi:glycosyltransferase, partial [Rhizobium ruizarguesonis]